MPQHALRREDHQRLAPLAYRLTSQKMEILPGIGRLTDLDIVPRSQLQKAFDARAGMLRALSFVAVRQQKHQAREQAPLVFSRSHELVNHRLRDISEVAE